MLFRRHKPAIAAARTVKTFGIEEQTIREKLKDSGLTMDILSHPKGVDILVKIEGEAGASATSLIDAAEDKIRRRLGNSVFGTDKDRMEEVAGRLLAESGKTLAVAESCTGGLICHMITNIPGCSKYFKQGFVVYDEHSKTSTLRINPETLKKFGAVSRQAVEEMARNAMAAASADASIAVTGIAGPGGGTPGKPVGTVFICASTGNKTETKEFHFKGWRELIKIQAAQAALDSLRRMLEDSE